MLLTPRPELERRIGRLQARLQEQGLDGAPAPQHHLAPLLHGVRPAGPPLGAGRRYGAVSVRRVLARARRESPLGDIEPLTSLRALPEHLGGARRIGMELDRMPVARSSDLTGVTSPTWRR